MAELRTTVTLPDAVTMQNRLRASMTSEHVAQHFFPLLRAHAGEQMDADSIVMMLEQAAKEYCHGLTADMTRTFNALLPFYVGPLVNDKTVYEEVIERLEARASR